MLQILIADDHALLRKGLQLMLDAHEGWKVCAEAIDGRQAVEMVEQLHPEVAIVDLLMPGLNGLETTRRIREVSPGTGVLVLTGGYSERSEEDAVAAGARAFVVKTADPERVVQAIEALERGETFLAEERRGSRRRAAARAGGAQAAGLTHREIEIAQLLAEGKTNWCIATILGISVRTVETHRANVMQKLGLQSVVELVHYAVRNLMVETLPSPSSDALPRTLTSGH